MQQVKQAASISTRFSHKFVADCCWNLSVTIFFPETLSLQTIVIHLLSFVDTKETGYPTKKSLCAKETGQSQILQMVNAGSTRRRKLLHNSRVIL